MKSGPRPKPVEQKRAVGNPGKRALPKAILTVMPATAPPPAPLTLLPAGIEQWERL